MFGRSSHSLRLRRILAPLSAAALAFALLLLIAAMQAPAAGATGRTIMVITPHPDDEVLIGAGVIANARAAGDTVKIVYMTNGDKPDEVYTDGPAKGLERQGESVKALAVLGLTEDDLIFLGYPDGSLDIIFEQITYLDPASFLTGANGLTATYGARGFGRADYHYTAFGSHALYNRPNVAADLDAILTAYRPEAIYTTSRCDAHRDHYSAYHFARLAILRRMAADQSYQPTLNQAIVWTSPDWGATWPLALDPLTPFTEPPGLPGTGLEWSARESLPVPTDMQSTDPAVNRKIRAINEEKMEGGVAGFLGKFVHSDEVFWPASLTMSFTVNSGSPYTTGTAATLNCAVGDASDASYGSPLTMRFSNNRSTWSEWVDYGASMSWTLTSGDGAKTVSAQFRDAWGNVIDADDTITVDGTHPAGSFAVNDGALYAATTAVTLDNAITDVNPLVMQFRNGPDGEWSDWQPYAASRSWTLAAGDGLKTVSGHFKDAAGNEFTTTDTITLDAVPVGSFTIAGGAQYSATATVTLDSSVTDYSAIEMRFKDSTGDWSDWQPYAATRSWNLPGADGLKTVAAEYRDEAGNVLETADTITLDTTLPAGTMAINDGGAYAAAAAVMLNSVVSDTNPLQMRFRNGPAGDWSDWQPYAAGRSWTLSAGDGAKTVDAQYRDAAGNVLETSDGITLDTGTPSGAMAINGGLDYTKTVAVTLNSNITDANALQMRFSNNGGTTWTDWEAYNAGKSWSLNDGDGPKTVEAEYRDPAGNTLALSDGIILNTVAPSGMLAIAGGAEFSMTTAVVLDSSVTGAVEMRFSSGIGAAWSTWEPFAAQKSWTLPAGDGLKTVAAQYRSNAGHVLAVLDTVVLDMTAPSGNYWISNGAQYTTSTSVTLDSDMSDLNGVVRMQFRNGTIGGWSAWESYVTSKNWTLPDGDGSKTVWARFEDGAGNVIAVSDTIILKTNAPTGGLVINGGAAYTSSAAVTLTSAVTDAATVRFREAGGTWPAWETYAASRAWTLSAGDGQKTIEGQYRDVALNVATFQATIVLDTAAPQSTKRAPSAIWNRVATTVELTATDIGSGPARLNVTLDGIAQPVVSTSVSVPIAAPADHSNDGLHTIVSFAEDGAGNREAPSTITVGVDTTKPQTAALKRATVKRGGSATLKFKVVDAAPNGGTATVAIKIKTLRGKVVKQMTVKDCRVNVPTQYKFRCTLKKGTYVFVVAATDTAGNTQGKSGSNKLIVR